MKRKNRREEGGNVMLCKQILYLKGNKKSTKNAVKYLHLWRFRQNIKSSCTVKSPVLFLYFFSFLSYFGFLLYVLFCCSFFFLSSFFFCIESCSYRERSSTKPQRWSWWLAVDSRMAKNQPCGRSYSSLDEHFIKSIHVPKNTSKNFGIPGLCFSSCVFYKLIYYFGSYVFP